MSRMRFSAGASSQLSGAEDPVTGALSRALVGRRLSLLLVPMLVDVLLRIVRLDAAKRLPGRDLVADRDQLGHVGRQKGLLLAPRGGLSCPCDPAQTGDGSALLGSLATAASQAAAAS